MALNTKGWATKTFSGMAGVGVGFRPECTGQKKGEARFPRAAQTCRGRSAGRAPREGRWEQQELESAFQWGISSGKRPVSEFTHPSLRAEWLACPLKCQSYLAQILQ